MARMYSKEAESGNAAESSKVGQPNWRYTKKGFASDLCQFRKPLIYLIWCGREDLNLHTPGIIKDFRVRISPLVSYLTNEAPVPNHFFKRTSSPQRTIR